MRKVRGYERSKVFNNKMDQGGFVHENKHPRGKRRKKSKISRKSRKKNRTK